MREERTKLISSPGSLSEYVKDRRNALRREYEANIGDYQAESILAGQMEEVERMEKHFNIENAQCHRPDDDNT